MPVPEVKGLKCNSSIKSYKKYTYTSMPIKNCVHYLQIFLTQYNPKMG
jgi:hypothetical protein